jgi:hypothetical protein
VVEQVDFFQYLYNPAHLNFGQTYLSLPESCYRVILAKTGLPILHQKTTIMSLIFRLAERRRRLYRGCKALSAVALCMVLLSEEAHAQADWMWAKSSSGPGSSGLQSMCTDTFGNVLITGDFSGANLVLNTVTLTSTDPAANTFYVAKYKSDGSILWAKTFPQTFNASGSAIVTDKQGNVFVAGSYISSITFGTTVLNSNGESDIFLVKLDANGDVQWAKSGGGTGSDGAYGLAVDNAGNVVMTGSFAAGNLSFGTQTVSGTADGNFYVAKFEGNGTIGWLKSNSSNGSSSGRALAVDGSNNVYVTGGYTAQPFTFGTATVPNMGSSDVFVSKLSSAGNVEWVKSIGGASSEGPVDIALDAGSNIYVLAYYIGSLSFAGSTLTSAGMQDVLLAKFNSSGNPVWGKSGGGEGADLPSSMAIDKNGVIHTLGTFGMMDKSATFGTNVLQNKGQMDVFHVTYNSEGNVTAAQGFGNTGMESGNAVAVDKNANLFIAGTFFSPSIDIGSKQLSLAAGSFSSIFIAKYGKETIGISSIIKPEDWNVYPNPAGSLLEIECAQIINTIQVFDMSGRLLQSLSPQAQHATLSLDQFAAGTYWIQLLTNKGTGLKQVVKR